MSEIVGEVVAANEAYVRGFGKKGELPLPPARRFAILTCMDARLDPAKYAGLAEGDAHVIRNAGGRATDDAIRSLVISHKLLGTQEWFVIHHTNCGMELFADEVIADLLEDDLSTASFDGKTWSNPHHHGGHAAGHFIKWHTIKNQPDSVTQDVRRIREHPWFPRTCLSMAMSTTSEPDGSTKSGLQAKRVGRRPDGVQEPGRGLSPALGQGQ
jgi:carbonic anhydrase